MIFEVYNYQCSPLAINDELYTEEAKEYREEALKAMERHLEIIDQMLTADILNYPVGSVWGSMVFKEENVLRLLRKKVRNRKRNVSYKVQAELSQPFLKALLLYAKDGFYVMSVQNKTLLSSEREWERQYVVNQPSCMVILANTPGRQLLLVEANGAFGKSNKKKMPTMSVCRIFEDSFKALLRPHKLNINFRPHYGTNEVWKSMIEKFDRGIGLKSLAFQFDYPNMAADAKLLRGYFEEIGIELNASQEYKLKGQHGQALNFDPREGKRNEHIVSIVNYGGATGNKQVFTYMDHSKLSFDANQVGISTLIATPVIERLMKRILEEELKVNQQCLIPDTLIPDHLRDQLAPWLNGLKTE